MGDKKEAKREKKKKEKEEKKKEKEEKKKEEKEKKPKEKKAPQGPVHIGSSELMLKSELDPSGPIFAQGKEKMRSVKKFLKALDKPDPNQSTEEQVSNTRRCLMKIGRHIDSILSSMEGDKTEWRSYLWYFVSNFTEFDAKKLFKLYRHAVKKDELKRDDEEGREGSQEAKKEKKKPK